MLNANNDRATQLFAQGNTHLNQKQYAQAEAAYSAILDLNPDDKNLKARAHNHRGFVYVQMGQHFHSCKQQRRSL